MSTQTKAKNSRLVGLAITTALATTALSGCTGHSAPTANYSAAQAEVALKKGKASKAVSHAEAAVLAAPRDAYARTLLGNAYLEAGRFASAATTFGEAVELGDTAPRTVVSYALAQIGAGDQNGALDTLTRFEASLDPADFGLAVALAGRPQQGVHVLSNALRQGNNTPKVRQNLAYAFALAGDWRSARLMASEDVPADEVGDRMAQWAAMVSPEQAQTRVAALLEVRPVADPGQPVALALNNSPSTMQLAAESAAAADAPAFALAGELPAVAGNDMPALDNGDAALADAGLVAAPSAQAHFAAAEVAQPVKVAAPVKPAAAPARTSYQQAFVPAAKPSGKSAAAPSLAHVDLAHGDYAVQLGSFSSMSAAHDAWKEFQRRYPELAGAEKAVTKARVNGKIFYRVAAVGYAKASATEMCSIVKGKGGACLAYAKARPLPGAIREDIRVATR